MIYRQNEVAASDAERAALVRVASQRAEPVIIVIDGDCAVLFDSIKPTEHELRLLLSDDGKKLRSHVERVVRTMMHDRMSGDNSKSGISILDGQRFVRLTRLSGNDGMGFAVSIENFRGGDSLSRAARKHQLTRREVDVLAMLLEGASAAETAIALNIAETTVQNYVKRLLAKTKSRNRPAMVANVLDWAGTNRRSRVDAPASHVSEASKARLKSNG
jgi:DNA-binding CsgD family transcriptional regulator